MTMSQICLRHSVNVLGLVTLNEMKAKQEIVVKEREKHLAHKQSEVMSAERQQEERKNKEQRKVSLYLIASHTGNFNLGNI